MARDHVGMLADARLLLEGDNMPSIQSAADAQHSVTALVCLRQILMMMSVLGNIAHECCCY